MSPSRNPHDQAIATIRFLAVDMVEKAASGHPGAPMAQAPLAYLLWTRFLRHNPSQPTWPNRDRFVLSCGHASALLYALLHLSGYPLTLADLKRFRQYGSKTPGHPERNPALGIETTTGPLGQGLGNAVGMAMAQRHLAARFNRRGLPLVDYRTWVLASDGDVMEGVASEACSLAGHLRLGHLNVIYDSNDITIDGSTSLAFSEQVTKRFDAYGWHTRRVASGENLEALASAFREARDETDRPSLILVRTHIGYGSPKKQDTADAHGAALGPEEVEATKRALGWPLEPTFHVPEPALRPFRQAHRRGQQAYERWCERWRRYQENHPDEAREFTRRREHRLPSGWSRRLSKLFVTGKDMATRSASGVVLNACNQDFPELMGGSADLSPSNQTLLAGEADFSAHKPHGRNLRFGVREHGMAAILNGLALSGMAIPYGGTFLIFSDYMRPSIRLAALMALQVIYVFTHDSIFLGEDGPTHQPVSQIAALRAIPNLTVLRPADAWETAYAWRHALKRRSGPTALLLTRQKVPTLECTAKEAVTGVDRGAYVLVPEAGEAQAILLASGSEVSLAVEAHQELAHRGITTRVVSFPSWEIFASQKKEYRDQVLPPTLPYRLAIEAGTSFGWERYVGDQGEVMSVDRWGASAPAERLCREYGFTKASVVDRVLSMLGGGAKGAL